MVIDCGRICSLGGQVPESGNQERRKEHLLRERRVSCFFFFGLFPLLVQCMVTCNCLVGNVV